MAKTIAVRYTKYDGQVEYQKVNWFRHEGFGVAGTTAKDIPEDGYAFATIKCRKCGGNDWTDNGEYINQYECACCGSYLTVEPKNG